MNAMTFAPRPNWSKSTRRLNALIERADAADRRISPRITRTPAQLARIMPNSNAMARRNAIELLEEAGAEFAVCYLLDTLAAVRAGNREGARDGIGALMEELEAMVPAAICASDIREEHYRMVADLRSDPDRGDWLRDQREDR